MKKKKDDIKKGAPKRKFTKPVIVTKLVTDSVVKVYGTYGPGNPVTQFGS